MRSACANDTHGHRPSAMRRTLLLDQQTCDTFVVGKSRSGPSWNMGNRCRTIPLVHVIFGTCGIPVRSLNQNFNTRTSVPLASAKLQWRRRSSLGTFALSRGAVRARGGRRGAATARASGSSIILASDTVSQAALTAASRRGGAREHVCSTHSSHSESVMCFVQRRMNSRRRAGSLEIAYGSH